MPQARSPVDFFRQLLAMSPDEREKTLTNHPPEIRDRILAKVAEYEALDPDERELRLRATELRWYLMPLLRDAPTNRAAQLAQVPDDIRELVQSRLEQWMILPPPLQQEFLDNERMLRSFASVDSTNAPPSAPEPGGPSSSDQARWNALTENQRRQITVQFNQFFELTPDEKQETLNTLSAAERAQMEKTLQSFDKLPPAQRAECVRAFAKFAEHERAGKSGVFEKCRALVANVAHRTPDLARPRRQCARNGRRCRPDSSRERRRPCQNRFLRPSPPTTIERRISSSPFPPPRLNLPSCIRLRFNSARHRFIGMA